MVCQMAESVFLTFLFFSHEIEIAVIKSAGVGCHSLKSGVFLSVKAAEVMHS